MKKWAYYNEHDPFAAAWLRELIKAGAIADGEVDERDMWDVVPADLVRFTQVHLCAGIGGWSAALRLAGWPDDRPVWTVSLPCQPFSAAGKGAGLADERGQLAEAFFWLAGICRPECIFGEQVEAAIKHDWLDIVATSLESIGYAVGAVGFPASSVGAFHLRQRLYWVANAMPAGRAARRSEPRNGQARGTATSPWQTPGELGDSDGQRRIRERLLLRAEETGWEPGNILETTGTGATHFWSDAEWIYCRDGEYRPIQRAAQSESIEMGDGLRNDLGLVRLARRAEGEEQGEEVRVYAPLVARGRNRVGRLRGYGNAICVPAAAEFIKAFMESA